MIDTPIENVHLAEDPAVLRCPRCKTPDDWTILPTSYVNGIGKTLLLVKCNMCGAIDNPVGPQDWILQIARMAKHA